MTDRRTPPRVSRLPELTIPPLTSYTLTGGVKLHVVSGGDAEVTRMSILVRGGLCEIPSADVSALLPLMLIEGTERMTSAEIAQFFDYRGAWIHSETGIHRTSVTLSALNSNFREILPVMADIVAAPAFDSDVLTQVAHRTASQIMVEQAKVSYHASAALRSMIYGPEHPLAANASPGGVTAVTSGDLHDCYRRMLYPANVEIFMAGKIDSDVVSTMTDFAAAIPATGSTISIADIPAKPAVTSRRCHISKPDAMQSAVRMGLLLPGRMSDDFVALRLLVTALGGYFGSRLMLNIREDKGYTYGINAITLGYAGFSVMSISSEADAAYVEPLIAETIAEIERMKDPASYTEEEIERLRSFAISNLASMLDTPLTVMDHYRSSAIAGAPADYFYRQQQAILSITAESLSALARRYFDTSQLYIATAGK